MHIWKFVYGNIWRRGCGSMFVEILKGTIGDMVNPNWEDEVLNVHMNGIYKKLLTTIK